MRFKVLDKDDKVLGYVKEYWQASDLYGKHYKEGPRIVALVGESAEEKFNNFGKSNDNTSRGNETKANPSLQWVH